MSRLSTISLLSRFHRAYTISWTALVRTEATIFTLTWWCCSQPNLNGRHFNHRRHQPLYAAMKQFKWSISSKNTSTKPMTSIMRCNGEWINSASWFIQVFYLLLTVGTYLKTNDRLMFIALITRHWHPVFSASPLLLWRGSYQNQRSDDAARACAATSPSLEIAGCQCRRRCEQ